MRIFWSFIALLALATCALFILPPRSGGETSTVAITTEARPAAIEAERSVPVESRDPTIDEQGTTSDEDEREVVTPSPEVVVPASTETAESPDADTPTASPEPQSLPEDDAAATTTDDQPPAADPDSDSDSDAISTGTPVAANPEPEPAPVESENLAADTEGADTPLTDDRFEVKGKGTREDPYQVTWEHLTSAYETYRPKEDKTEIPEHIAILHDRYVRITGYLAFPMLEGEVTEALVMLNQWDGCCLGVPPSPYDSIEVNMEVSMIAERGASTPFGAVTGKIKIDPYLVNGWLVGLYIMEEATIETVG